MTAMTDQTYETQGKLAGATAFITKPVGIDQLRRVVREVLHL